MRESPVFQRPLAHLGFVDQQVESLLCRNLVTLRHTAPPANRAQARESGAVAEHLAAMLGQRHMDCRRLSASRCRRWEIRLDHTAGRTARPLTAAPSGGNPSVQRLGGLGGGQRAGPGAAETVAGGPACERTKSHSEPPARRGPLLLTYTTG
jgi:hypothetical protein